MHVIVSNILVIGNLQDGESFVIFFRYLAQLAQSTPPHIDFVERAWSDTFSPLYPTSDRFRVCRSRDTLGDVCMLHNHIPSSEASLCCLYLRHKRALPLVVEPQASGAKPRLISAAKPGYNPERPGLQQLFLIGHCECTACTGSALFKFLELGLNSLMSFSGWFHANRHTD
jgi:hypothetical protein